MVPGKPADLCIPYVFLLLLLSKGIRTGQCLLLFGSFQALLSLSGATRLGRSGLGAASQSQVKNALHQRTRSAAIARSFTYPLNDFLLGLVDAFGDQVLCNIDRSFLRGFFTTGSGSAAYVSQRTVRCGSTKALEDSEDG